MYYVHVHMSKGRRHTSLVAASQKESSSADVKAWAAFWRGFHWEGCLPLGGRAQIGVGREGVQKEGRAGAKWVRMR